jgi:hypothetical protein
MTMPRRGRRSAADLATVRPIAVVPRPDPPDDLDEEEAGIWRAVVDRLPADWFPAETRPMLAQLCRHTVGARFVGDMIRDLRATLAERIAQGEDRLETLLGATECLDRLLKMQERESRAIAALMRSMRLTQQSRYSARKTVPGTSSGPPPWEWHPPSDDDPAE